jgi:hypothetical protein
MWSRKFRIDNNEFSLVPQTVLALRSSSCVLSKWFCLLPLAAGGCLDPYALDPYAYGLSLALAACGCLDPYALDPYA